MILKELESVVELEIIDPRGYNFDSETKGLGRGFICAEINARA